MKNDDDTHESLETLKFRADFLYARKDYQGAQNQLKMLLRKSSKSSKGTPGPLYRDVCESYVRCLAHQKSEESEEEALELAKDLVSNFSLSVFT